MFAFGWGAKPLSGMFCGVPGTPPSLSKKLKVPAREPDLVGAKTRASVQLAPGASVTGVEPQLLAPLLIEKSLAPEPIAIVVITSGPPPILETVYSWVLEAPTFTVAKPNDPGPEKLAWAAPALRVVEVRVFCCPPVLEVTVNVAFLVPLLVGVNVKVTRQLAPG